MKAITNRQRDVLKLLDRYLSSGVPPSSARLAHELGLAGESSLTPILQAMAKKGYLTIEGGVRGRQRTIRITPKGQLELGRRGLAVMGSIPAGPLQEALQTSGEFIERLEQALPFQEGDFLLKVRGESMTGAGIHDGDLVLIRPDVDIRPGEICAVCIGDNYEATLKRVWLNAKGSGGVRLQAANPDYPDQEYPLGSVRIVGVMRGLLRSIS